MEAGETRSQPAQSARLYRPVHSDPCQGRAVRSRIWLHEIKHDGYRIIARKDRERVRLWSRHGLSWTAAFPLIVEALRAVPADCVVLDGEAVLECEDARHDFHGLRTGAAKNACLFAFDLLAVDERGLTPSAASGATGPPGRTACWRASRPEIERGAGGRRRADPEARVCPWAGGDRFEATGCALPFGSQPDVAESQVRALPQAAMSRAERILGES